MKNGTFRWIMYGTFGTLFIWLAIGHPWFWFVVIAGAVVSGMAFIVSNNDWPTRLNWMWATFAVFGWTLIWYAFRLIHMSARGAAACLAMSVITLRWPLEEDRRQWRSWIIPGAAMVIGILLILIAPLFVPDTMK